MSFVIVLADRTLLGGAFGYIALVSGLLGIAALLSVKLLFKEEGTPSYLPTPSGDAPDEPESVADASTPNPDSLQAEEEEKESESD